MPKGNGKNGKGETGPTVVELTVRSMTVQSTRKLPVYNGATGNPVSYSSEETGMGVTFECAVPLEVEVGAEFRPGTADYMAALAKKLQDVVGSVAGLVADEKARGGVSLPQPRRVEYRSNGQAKEADGF